MTRRGATTRLVPSAGAALACVLLASLALARAQPVVWDRQAFGQLQGLCNPADPNSGWYWPSNNFWSQSQVIGPACNGVQNAVTAPSNWSTTNYPNGANVDVIIGNMGAAGTLADVNVTLKSLTLLTNGSLTVGSVNLAANYFDFQGDGTMFQSGNDVVTLLPGGLMEKSGGTGSYQIVPPVAITGGTVQADSGTLVLGASLNLTCSDGTFYASNNAVVDLTGGGAALWAGNWTGGGAGHVELNSGAIVSPGLTLNFPADFFWWTGGNLGISGQGESVFTNAGAMTVFSSGAPALSAATLNNSGLILETNSGVLNDGVLNNLAAGAFQFAGDGSLGPNLQFVNYGLVRKSDGASNSVIGDFYNEGGVIEADSGMLTLEGDGASSNGVFNVASGAVVDLTGGSRPNWSGVLTGSGAGQVLLQNGEFNGDPSVALDFPPGLFWWTGGGLNGTVSNLDTVTISASGAPSMNFLFYNQGAVLQTNSGNVGFGPLAFYNQPLAIYDFGGDGGSASGSQFVNYGLLRKASGTGVSVMGAGLVNLGGVIEADSGTLVLGNSGSSSNGTFVVAANAAVDLTGANAPTWAGTMTGSGAGQVLLQNSDGVINLPPMGMAVNFPPGMFLWTGGSFGGHNDNGTYFGVTNLNSITIFATNSPSLYYSFLWNNGVVRQTNAGTFSVGAFALENQSSGVYEFDGDGGVSGNQFVNWGLLRKASGTGQSIMGAGLINLGGVIEADSGTLVLANSGSSSNGTFVVAANAAIDLTGANAPTWAGTMTGSGAGNVLLQNSAGAINIPPMGMAVNFPPGMFLWSGGSFAGHNVGGTYYGVTNLNSITISGGNSPSLSYCFLWNYGIVRQTNSGTFGIGAYALEIEPSGVYEFDGDGGVTGNQFNNFGLVRKSFGTGVSTVASLFANYGGAIEVDSGTLSVPSGFSTGGGSLTIALGGYSPGQNGQLLVNGPATLDGAVKVVLTNNFNPAASNQFQILACSGLSGAFTNVALPAGFSLSYSNSGVYLAVLPPPATLQSSSLSQGNFSFSFQTLTNQSYTVEQSTNLATPDWFPFTNFAGNGGLMNIVAPFSNYPQQFFRVTEP
jgi:hypothetical protein